MSPEVVGQSASEWWAWWATNSQAARDFALTVAAALGLPLLAWRTWNIHRQSKAALQQAETAARRHEAQADADRERRIVESFTRAVDQLGSDKLETRLGAIYALERIARESPRDHWPIMETLTAFVREGAPCTPEKEERAAEEKHVRPPTDVQAVLTVIGRRRREHDPEGQRLDLRGVDLRGADLMNAHLEGANFYRAHLNGAILSLAHLEGAHFTQAHLENAGAVLAHLERAYLQFAHLEGAELIGARLEGADLREAHLKGTRLDDAHLERAQLFRAHLEGAVLYRAKLDGARLIDAHLQGADLRESDITQEQLDRAITDETTEVPPGLRTKASSSGAGS